MKNPQGVEPGGEVVQMADRPLVSIIIPARNEGENVANTVKSMTESLNATPFEIIVVDDGSEDGCCRFLTEKPPSGKIRMIRTSGLGSARARNAGAAMARGEVFIFCDAHIFVEEQWIDKLVEPIGSGLLDAVCPAISPHDRPHDMAGGFTWDERLNFTWLPRPDKISPVPLLPGGCMAVGAGAFAGVEGFERGFMVWGREDEEFSLKMWLFGYRLGVVPDVRVLHIFRQKHPYRVTWEHVDYNLLRMAYSHFSSDRIARVLELIKHHPGSGRVARRVLESDVLDQRKRYFNRRQRNDDWFFNKFRIPF